jgi:hypothetical protein
MKPGNPVPAAEGANCHRNILRDKTTAVNLFLTREGVFGFF